MFPSINNCLFNDMADSSSDACNKSKSSASQGQDLVTNDQLGSQHSDNVILDQLGTDSYCHDESPGGVPKSLMKGLIEGLTKAQQVATRNPRMQYETPHKGLKTPC